MGPLPLDLTRTCTCPRCCRHQASRPDLAPRLHYIFIPCNGSVVTGQGDIGCNGHKNAAGQAEVAGFLEPRLRTILGW